MLPFAFIVLGYLRGSIPFGLILTQAAGLGDIRTIGSGNIGATNVLRTGNKKIAAATLLLDALKGAAAVVMAAGALADPIAAHQAALWAGLGAVLGHLFPVWLKFKGGKGAATAYGVLIAACWPVGLAAGAVWIAVAATLRISSVATLISFAAAPILAFALADADLVKLSLIISMLVWVRHHANIRRILSGTEPRIGRGSAKA